MVFYASSPGRGQTSEGRRKAEEAGESRTSGKSEANLENDTERKKRAIKEEDSEDSKELSIERC